MLAGMEHNQVVGDCKHVDEGICDNKLFKKKSALGIEEIDWVR